MAHDDKVQRNLLLTAALLGGSYASGVAFVAPKIGERIKKESIRTGPLSVLRGDYEVPKLDQNQLAEILATDPRARKRWTEVKAAMEKVESLADQKIRTMREQGKSWIEREDDKSVNPSLRGPGD
jgi:hypothetical protein